jgi:hypothetical protein
MGKQQRILGSLGTALLVVLVHYLSKIAELRPCPKYRHIYPKAPVAERLSFYLSLSSGLALQRKVRIIRFIGLRGSR